MDLQELRQKPHISASGYSQFLDCGLSYYLSKIVKQKPDFIPDALLFGNAIHQTLAYFYQEIMVGIIMSAKDIESQFELKWKEIVQNTENIKYKTGKDYKILLLEGKELLTTFRKNFSMEGYTIIGIEEPFSFNIDDIPVAIIGAFDLILEDIWGGITIVDTKTSSKSYTNSEIDNNIQLTIYQMAIKSNGFKNREILLRFDCLIKTKIPKFETYYTTRSELDELKTIKKLKIVYEGITKGVFIPNEGSWKCQGCQYKTACEKWFIERS